MISYDKMHLFTSYRKDNDCIIPGDQYNNKLKIGKILSIMVSNIYSISRRREKQKRQDTNIQALLSLTEFLDKEIRKSPPTRISINVVRIWSEMGCGISFSCGNLKNKIRIGAFLPISKNFLWIMWKETSRVSRIFPRKINMWFRALCHNKFTQGKFC